MIAVAGVGAVAAEGEALKLGMLPLAMCVIAKAVHASHANAWIALAIDLWGLACDFSDFRVFSARAPRLSQVLTVRTFDCRGCNRVAPRVCLSFYFQNSVCLSLGCPHLLPAKALDGYTKTDDIF